MLLEIEHSQRRNGTPNIINRPKFKITAREIAVTIDCLFKNAEFVTPLDTGSATQNDPSDNKFLEAGVEGKVDYIVSGDSHLLELRTLRGIPIHQGI